MFYLCLFKKKTYDLDFFHEVDNQNNDFINVIGRKDTFKLYDQYRYSLGFDRRLIEIKKLLEKCNDPIEYVDNVETMQIIRKEGYLLDMFHNDHESYLYIMNIIKDLIKQVRPDKYPVYLKDKLNMNRTGWKFKLHQDASAGWRDKNAELTDSDFVTIGIPMNKITDIDQGPTRIAIRQGLNTTLVPETNKDNTVNEELYNSRLGKSLQYLICYGVEGTYYLFDQFVLHDSSFNLKDQNRDVLFITVALVDEIDIHSMKNVEMAKLFYKNKKVLDKKTIQTYLDEGYKITDFKKDIFGKITLA